MNVFSAARSIYVALRDDAESMAAIRAERARLALEIATNPQSGLQVTSSTVNGQSFTANASGMMTNAQRLSMLSLICKMDDEGMVPTSVANAVF